MAELVVALAQSSLAGIDLKAAFSLMVALLTVDYCISVVATHSMEQYPFGSLLV